jgi:hypothetical protein
MLFLVVLLVMGVGGVRLALDDEDDDLFLGDGGGGGGGGEENNQVHHEDLRAAVIARMQALPKPPYLVVKSGIGNSNETLLFQLPPEMQRATEERAEAVTAMTTATPVIDRLPLALRTYDARPGITLPASPERAADATSTSRIFESFELWIGGSGSGAATAETTSARDEPLNSPIVEDVATSRGTMTASTEAEESLAVTVAVGSSTTPPSAALAPEQVSPAVAEAPAPSQSRSAPAEAPDADGGENEAACDGEPRSQTGWESSLRQIDLERRQVPVEGVSVEEVQQEEQEGEAGATAVSHQPQTAQARGSSGGGMDCIVDSFSSVGDSLFGLRRGDRGALEFAPSNTAKEQSDDVDKGKSGKSDCERPEDPEGTPEAPSALALFHQQRAEAARLAEEEEAALCNLCCERRHNAVFLTCGHGGVCFSCAVDTYVRGRERCPFCRRRVGQIVCVGPVQAQRRKNTTQLGVEPLPSTALVTSPATRGDDGLKNFASSFFVPILQAVPQSGEPLRMSASALAARYSFGDDGGSLDGTDPEVGGIMYTAPVTGPTRSFVLEALQEMMVPWGAS